MSPYLSIIVPTHDRPELLLDLLNSIRDSQLRDIEHEVLVVSNLDDSATRALVGRFSYAVYACANSVGVNSARNEGLKRARGDIVFFMDDDCAVGDHLIFHKHLEHHNRWPHHAGVGGVYCPSGKSTLFGIAHWLSMTHWLMNVSDLTSTFRLIGGHASYKRRLIGSASFDPGIVYGSAEVSFNHNLYFEGHPHLLNPELQLLHEFDLSYEDMKNKCQKQAHHYREFFRGPHREFYLEAQKTERPYIEHPFIATFLSTLARQERMELDSILEQRAALFSEIFDDE